MLPKPSEAVIFKELSEGGVLFHTTEEVYFGLNHVGCVVWRCLPPAMDNVEDVCLQVQRQYPAEPMATIRTDVEELLEELVKFGLVVSEGVAGENKSAAVPTA